MQVNSNAGRGGGSSGRHHGGGGRSSGGGRRPRNNSNNHNTNSQNNHAHGGGYAGGGEQRTGGGGAGGGGGRGGRGGGGGRNRRNNHNNSNGRGGRGGGDNHGNNNVRRITIKDVQLLNETGMGNNNEQKKVIRINASELIRQRLLYLDPPTNNFKPNSHCHWTDDERISIIHALCGKVMELGDVSQTRSNPKHDTAPALEDCKPLDVNEEKRWKSRAMIHKTSQVEEVETVPETTEEILGKALLILNKLSWTTIDRLTVQFMETTNIANNEEVREQVVELLVRKAQTEHHFGPMYARLCATLSAQIKPFKKQLMVKCHQEFITDTADTIQEATRGMTDPEEIEYHATLIRKAYIGHMKFLGELYLQSVAKLSIMLECLEKLSKDEEHEESLECYVHLLTTMGKKLEGHTVQRNKDFDWSKVEKLQQSPNISVRIKFMLQDLIELRERGMLSENVVCCPVVCTSVVLVVHSVIGLYVTHYCSNLHLLCCVFLFRLGQEKKGRNCQNDSRHS